MSGDTVGSVAGRSRIPRKYAIRAVVFQEGEWLCAQCLEYDLVAQAKSLERLSRALQRLLVAHVAVRQHHKQQPFRDLPRAPEKYWAMFRRSRLKLPAPMFKLSTIEIPRRGGRDAPSSRRRSQRRLVRGSRLLPDAGANAR
jgi:hypothetical protein